MERPVGDKFKLVGCVFVVVEDVSVGWDNSCGKCAFHDISCLDVRHVTGICSGGVRKDMKSVHFEYFGVDW